MTSAQRSLVKADGTLVESTGKRVGRAILNNMPWVLALTAFVILSITTPPFLTAANLRNILLQSTLMSLLVLGCATLMMTGQTDIAIEDKLIFGAAIAAWLTSPHINASGLLWPSWTGVVIPIVVLTIITVVQSQCLLRLEMNPWMTSMSIAIIVTGLGTLLLSGAQVFPLPEDYRVLGIGKLGPVHISIIVVVVLYLVVNTILTRQPLGRKWMATGANARAARAAGINTNRIVTMAFVFCGLMGVLGGWMWLGRTNSVDVTMARGVTYEVIAAAVMGGISMRGGHGNVLMAWAGIFLLTLITNGLNLNNVPSTYVAAAKGILIFLACLLDGLRNRGSL